eukprot:2600496-Pleurochrysis_carterae.AAC.2
MQTESPTLAKALFAHACETAWQRTHYDSIQSLKTQQTGKFVKRAASSVQVERGSPEDHADDGCVARLLARRRQRLRRHPTLLEQDTFWLGWE